MIADPNPSGRGCDLVPDEDEIRAMCAEIQAGWEPWQEAAHRNFDVVNTRNGGITVVRDYSGDRYDFPHLR